MEGSKRLKNAIEMMITEEELKEEGYYSIGDFMQSIFIHDPLNAALNQDIDDINIKDVETVFKHVLKLIKLAKHRWETELKQEDED